MLLRLRTAILRGDMKVNVDKTKLLVSAKPLQTRTNTGRHHSKSNLSVVLSATRGFMGVFFGITSFASVQDFGCSTCVRPPRPISSDATEMDDGTIEKVEKFYYLGGFLDRKCHAIAAMKARISAAWAKWRQINSLLCNKGIPFQLSVRVYEACIRSVMI